MIEYSFYSLCEEIDLFYCQQRETKIATDTLFTEESLRKTLFCIVEALESYPYESEQWKSHLRQLYLLAMGSYRCEGDPVLSASRKVQDLQPAGISESQS